MISYIDGDEFKLRKHRNFIGCKLFRFRIRMKIEKL